jgi:hypothetical protein
MASLAEVQCICSMHHAHYYPFFCLRTLTAGFCIQRLTLYNTWWVLLFKSTTFLLSTHTTTILRPPQHRHATSGPRSYNETDAMKPPTTDRRCLVQCCPAIGALLDIFLSSPSNSSTPPICIEEDVLFGCLYLWFFGASLFVSLRRHFDGWRIRKEASFEMYLCCTRLCQLYLMYERGSTVVICPDLLEGLKSKETLSCV